MCTGGAYVLYRLPSFLSPPLFISVHVCITAYALHSIQCKYYQVYIILCAYMASSEWHAHDSLSFSTSSKLHISQSISSIT